MPTPPSDTHKPPAEPGQPNPEKPSPSRGQNPLVTLWGLLTTAEKASKVIAFAGLIFATIGSWVSDIAQHSRTPLLIGGMLGLSAGTAAAAIGSGLLLRVFQSVSDLSAPLKAVNERFKSLYTDKDFSEFGSLQTVLRLFIASVSIASSALLFQQDSASRPQAVSRLLVFQIYLSGIYILASLVQWFQQTVELRSIQAQRHSLDADQFFQRISHCFNQAVYVDLAFVTLIWATTLYSGRPFHLAFIVPMMVAWIVAKHLAARVFTLVLIGLTMRYVVLACILLARPSLAAGIGYQKAREYHLALEFSAMAAFWLLLGLVFAMLRFMRTRASVERDAAIETARATEAAQAAEHAAKEREETLRICLQALGTGQKQAVFAKDSNGRFIFANEILLEILNQRRAKKGKSAGEPWNANSIIGMGDVDIGIPEDVYEKYYSKSDKQVLIEAKHDRSKAHFSGLEPSFLPEDLPGTMLWTHKESVFGTSGEIVGLVGYIVPGMPVEMRNFVCDIFEKLPIYASIKNDKNRVVWANERHLEKLAPRINKLVRDNFPLMELESFPLLARMKAINGDGPTDVQLYDELGAAYQDLDNRIVSRARSHKGTQRDFEVRVLADILEEAGCVFADGRFPAGGWMEYHRFPGESEGRWVEVWKLPRWGDRLDGKPDFWEVKGVLVFFRDVHESYLRRSVVWRWLNGILQKVERANHEAIEQISKDKSRRSTSTVDALAIIQARAPRLFLSMLCWFRSFVDSEPQTQTLSFGGGRRLSELRGLLLAIQGGYRREFDFELRLAEDELLASDADVVFAVVATLACNSADAILNRSNVSDSGSRKLIVSVSRGLGVYMIEVLDDATVLSERQLEKMRRLEAVRDGDGLPGGGLFLVRRLSQCLWSRSGRECPGSILDLRGRSPGLQVTVTLPVEGFHRER